jgi:hypothetical protein
MNNDEIFLLGFIAGHITGFIINWIAYNKAKKKMK